jgi:UDP-GlcNAc3NAcA epimerase
MLSLITAADKVLTDSGGLQKEAIWLSTPCITLRDETEWVETTNGKWNQIVGAHTESILKAVQTDPEGACPVFGEIPGTTASNEITRLLTT